MNEQFGKFMIGAAVPVRWLEDGEFALHLASTRALCHSAALVSLPWAQIEPEPERVNAAVLSRCRTALESLRDADMEPVCILSDSVAPQWFDAQGGWAHPEAANRFRTYAACVAKSFAPLCQWWVPLAEPEYWLARTYHERGLSGYRHALTQMIRAHGEACSALRAARTDAKVGLSVRVFSAEPADIDSPWDLRAARRLEHRLNHRMADRLREISGKDAFDFVLPSWGGVVSAWFSPGQWLREWVTTVDKNRARISLQDAHWDAARFDEALSALLGYQTPILVLGENEQSSTLHAQLRAVSRRCAEEGGDRVAGFLLRSPLDKAEWELNSPLLETMRAGAVSPPHDLEQ